MGKETEVAKMVKITLEAPHEHVGVMYQAGDVIEVADWQAEWLKAEWAKNKKEGK